MEITFTKQGRYYVAEFEVTANFNLHLEREKGGRIFIDQRTSGTQYVSVRDFGYNNDGILVLDEDIIGGDIFPKTMRIRTESLPTIAIVTYNA